MKALIVGGSSGIGKETAKILLKRNVEVVLVANNSKKKREEFLISSSHYAAVNIPNCPCYPA